MNEFLKALKTVGQSVKSTHGIDPYGAMLQDDATNDPEFEEEIKELEEADKLIEPDDASGATTSDR